MGHEQASPADRLLVAAERVADQDPELANAIARAVRELEDRERSAARHTRALEAISTFDSPEIEGHPAHVLAATAAYARWALTPGLIPPSDPRDWQMRRPLAL